MAADPKLSVPEEQAFQLSQAALKIDLARGKRDTDLAALVDALNQDLEVWVALRTIVMRADCSLAPEAKNNMVRLSKFVADKIFAGPEGWTDSVLDTLININLQISEGFLEGAKTAPAGH